MTSPLSGGFRRLFVKMRDLATGAAELVSVALTPPSPSLMLIPRRCAYILLSEWISFESCLVLRPFRNDESIELAHVYHEVALIATHEVLRLLHA